jgi:valyl-tRNA synthetase
MMEEADNTDFEIIQEFIGTVRNLRAENKVEPVLKVKLLIVADEKEQLLETQRAVIMGLARLEEMSFIEKSAIPNEVASAVMSGIELYLPLEGLIDVEAEKARLTKEIESLEKYIGGIEKKLSNKEFADNAPKEIVEAERKKLEEGNEKVGKMKEALGQLEG